MKPHVKEVLNLWKNVLADSPAEVTPYQMSPQLRNLAALFAPGLFYYYILNFPELKLEYVHESTKEILGLDPGGVTIDKLIELLAPDEREPMAKKEAIVVDFFANFLNAEEMLYYKSCYFFSIQDTRGKYRDMLHQAMILSLTDDNRPEHVMVVHTDVSHLHFTRNNSLSFISLRGEKSYFDVDVERGIFDPGKVESSTKPLREVLTKREKEIIKLISEGHHVEKISTELNISVHTIRTHRKNVLRKSMCKNTTELVAKCLMEGVI